VNTVSIFDIETKTCVKSVHSESNKNQHFWLVLMRTP